MMISRIFSRFPRRRFFATKNAAIVDNPYTGEVYCEVPYISSATADRLIERSQKAQKEWANVSLDKRIQICEKFCAEMKKQEQLIAADITNMMGKPLKQALGEIAGLIDRTRALNDLAPNALADYIVPGSPKGFHRRISREAIGVIFVLAPWNYPLLTAVNGVVAAVLSGNSVLLKHSPRTPLVADHFQKAFEAAGAPEGLVTAFHVDHDEAARVIKKSEIGYVQFTGSVPGGRAVYKAVSERFIDVGLELGGKDAAYVREDANLDHAVDSTVDGAIYNAGQSCCAIERVYVHQSLYSSYVEKARALLSTYRMGDPLKDTTNLGPMAQPNAVSFLSQQVQEAKEKRAKVLLGGVATTDSEGKGRFFPPTLITDCSHDMSVMTEESFGPIMAVMSVKDDKEAIKYINDSKYGLTAAIYTTNDAQALAIGRRLSVGTVFMNRCDYLDPYLPWTGLRASGKGVSLSHHAFHAMTRLKGFNFKSLNV